MTPDPLPPTLAALFGVFARISLTSFGGGVTGWMFRAFVVERRWLTEAEFLDAVAISQALPGVNVANIAIWTGHRLLGLPGAAVGFAGIILPAAVAVMLLATVLAAFSHDPGVTLALLGASAAAIALPLEMGIRTALRVPRRPVPLLVMVGCFASVALLHWPVPWVVLGFGTLSVALAFRA